jgi:hypothetical protein
MERIAPSPRRRTRRSLGREIELVETAIALVALGGSRRVSVGGLAHADRVLHGVNRVASQAGVRLLALPGASTQSTGIEVELIEPELIQDGAPARDATAR